MRAEVEQALATLQQNRPEDLERALTLLQDTVFSFSMKVCGHRQDAEDTMQETLLKAVAYLRRFRSPQALAVWLYKVAKNRCLLSRRKSKFAPKESLSLEELLPDRKQLERLTGPERSTPESSLLRGEMAQHLQQTLLKLPPPYRLVLVLHDMEELSTEEIAQVTGLRAGTVRVRLHRARVFVRNELARAARKPRLQRRSTKTKPRRCKQLFAALSDYLDGALDASLCDELEKHLDTCSPCQAFLASLERTVEQCRRHQPACLHPARAARMRAALLADYQRARGALQAAQHKTRTAG